MENYSKQLNYNWIDRARAGIFDAVLDMAGIFTGPVQTGTVDRCVVAKSRHYYQM